MDRRSALRRLGAGGLGLALLAGCSGRPSSTDERTDGRSDDGSSDDSGRSATTTDRSLASLGIPSDICEEPILSDPGIYAITAPAFAADWADRDVDPVYRREGESGLADGRTVVGVAADGRARAYPLSVLAYHEVVNDDFGGPLLVTYCPLCASGVVAERTVDGAATSFGVTGQLWQPPREYAAGSAADGTAFGAEQYGGEGEIRHGGNLLMYDEATRSYWSQVLARAICGERRGDRLPLRPSTVATWGEWREAHPDTAVLLPPPHSGTVDPPVD